MYQCVNNQVHVCSYVGNGMIRKEKYHPKNASLSALTPGGSFIRVSKQRAGRLTLPRDGASFHSYLSHLMSIYGGLTLV